MSSSSPLSSRLPTSDSWISFVSAASRKNSSTPTFAELSASGAAGPAAVELSGALKPTGTAGPDSAWRRPGSWHEGSNRSAPHAIGKN